MRTNGTSVQNNRERPVGQRKGGEEKTRPPSSLSAQRCHWTGGRVWIRSGKSLPVLVMMLIVVMSIVIIVGNGGLWSCCSRMAFSYIDSIGEGEYQSKSQIHARRV
jgi:hypothetical protein